ncbi:MAG: hypothetical protein LBQ77_02540 [Treponema sp.]|jgi:hypothetical protein|nr:hypothetical protein [Treponema sp.]
MIILVFLSFIAQPLAAQDTAIVARYIRWAEQSFSQNHRAEALAALERAQDFASVSSDVSYLLAWIRFQQKGSLGSVLVPLWQAIETNRWNTYTEESARLLEAEILITVRRFDQALRVLEYVPLSADSLWLKVRALHNIDRQHCLSELKKALALYPREPRLVRFFFEQYAELEPSITDNLILHLPSLVNADPSFLYIVSPFLTDKNQAVTLIESYRAMFPHDSRHLPAALNVGAIDEQTAIEELFAVKELDKTVLEQVYALLRTDSTQHTYMQRLLQFTGTITEDIDRDGVVESYTEYKNGSLQSYFYDSNQDGLYDYSIFFESELPKRAVLITTAEPAAPFAFPVYDSDRNLAHIQWEYYPYVSYSAIDHERYVPAAGSLITEPITLQHFIGSFLYPQPNPHFIPLNKNMLSMSARYIERPSSMFSNITEIVELNEGIPYRAREYNATGLLLSETVFSHGKPVTQTIDLDCDGRRETIWHFLPDMESAYILSYSESDWDNDGEFEYIEYIEYNHYD